MFVSTGINPIFSPELKAKFQFGSRLSKCPRDKSSIYELLEISHSIHSIDKISTQKGMWVPCVV